MKPNRPRYIATTVVLSVVIGLVTNILSTYVPLPGGFREWITLGCLVVLVVSVFALIKVEAKKNEQEPDSTVKDESTNLPDPNAFPPVHLTPPVPQLVIGREDDLRALKQSFIASPRNRS